MRYLLCVISLCALAACSNEEDYKWLPETGYVKSEAPEQNEPKREEVKMIDDLLGEYDAVTTIDGQESHYTCTIEKGKANHLLLKGFMQRTEPLALQFAVEEDGMTPKGNTLLVDSELWYDNYMLCNADGDDFAEVTFNREGVITFAAFNVCDTETFATLYNQCSATLTKKW